MDGTPQYNCLTWWRYYRIFRSMWMTQMKRKIAMYQEKCPIAIGSSANKETWKKLIPYEDCQISLWVVKESDKTTSTKEISKVTDCGTITEKEFNADKRTNAVTKKLTCFSTSVLDCSPATINLNISNSKSTYQVYSKDWLNCPISLKQDNNTRKCNIPVQQISDLEKYAKTAKEPIENLIIPISLLISFWSWITTDTGEKIEISCKDINADNAKWFEWKWSTCSSGTQIRKVECQSGGKKVDDNKCFWVKPSTSNSLACKDSSTSLTATPKKTTTYKCTDTDSGLDYTKKWSVTGIWDFYTGDLSDPKLITTHTDMCLNNYGTTNGLPIWLLEYSCDSDGRKTSTDYMCPNGCKDGACVKQSASVSVDSECKKWSCTIDGIKIIPGVDHSLIDDQWIEAIRVEIEDWKTLKTARDCINRAHILLTGTREIDKKMGQAQVNACVYYLQKLLK